MVTESKCYGPCWLHADNYFISVFIIIIIMIVIIILIINIFTALHVMQTRYSEENSVCLSVRLSVTRVIPDKTEERSVMIFIPYERIFIIVF